MHVVYSAFSCIKSIFVRLTSRIYLPCGVCRKPWSFAPNGLLVIVLRNKDTNDGAALLAGSDGEGRVAEGLRSITRFVLYLARRTKSTQSIFFEHLPNKLFFDILIMLIVLSIVGKRKEGALLHKSTEKV